MSRPLDLGELAPCSLCGGEAIAKQRATRWIECTECGLHLGELRDGEIVRDLAAAWNSRPVVSGVRTRVRIMAIRKYLNELYNIESLGWCAEDESKIFEILTRVK